MTHEEIIKAQEEIVKGQELILNAQKKILELYAADKPSIATEEPAPKKVKIAKKDKKDQKKKEKEPKAKHMNGYVIWCNEQRAKITPEQDEQIKQKAIKESEDGKPGSYIMKHLGQVWKTVSEDVKKHYQEISKKQNEQADKEFELAKSSPEPVAAVETAPPVTVSIVNAPPTPKPTPIEVPGTSTAAIEEKKRLEKEEKKRLKKEQKRLQKLAEKKAGKRASQSTSE